MPVAVNVMQKGSSVDNDDFGCGKVHLLNVYSLHLSYMYLGCLDCVEKSDRPLSYSTHI
jgi:hypothetical protein